MILLYTGASKQDAEQLNPDLSLGGHASSSQIPNDTLSNIFSVASQLSIQNKKREVKMIALKNNDGDVAADLTFTFATDNDSICNYKVAFVYPSISNDLSSCFEQIVNSSALPYYAQFSPITNGSVFTVNQMLNNSYIGIWLMREYNYNSNDLKKKSCTDWSTLLDAKDIDPNADVLNKQENLSFTLDYEVGDHSTSDSL
jgi:hypothetical protein